MKMLNKAFAKPIAGIAAAGAMAVSAVPAHANDRQHDRISAGEVIAGAVIVGGLAAILSSKKNKHRGYDSHHNGYEYNGRRGHNRKFRRGHNNHRVNYRRNGSRRAIRKCINRAEQKASYFGYADVTNIRDIKRTRYGYRVKGNVLVTKGRGYNRYSDRGRFTCYVDSGRVSEVRLRGLGKKY